MSNKKSRISTIWGLSFPVAIIIAVIIILKANLLWNAKHIQYEESLNLEISKIKTSRGGVYIFDQSSRDTYVISDVQYCTQGRPFHFEETEYIRAFLLKNPNSSTLQFVMKGDTLHLELEVSRNKKSNTLFSLDQHCH